TAGSGTNPVALTAAYDAAKTAATQASVNTIDDFVDTEVGAIKTVTDKLDTALELDGAVYRYTTNALEQAPTGTGGGGGATVAQIWDEPIAGHLTPGSTGAKLNSAGSAGDPWTTALPGSYGAGTAGKIVGDNINATVSSRATPAQVQTELGTYGAVKPTTAGRTLDIAATGEAGLDYNNVAGTPAVSAGVGTLLTRIPSALTITSGAVNVNDKTGFSLSTAGIDAVWAKTMTELAAVPAVTASTLDALRWIFLLARNKVTQTATTQALRNDADSATIATSTVS